MTLTQAEQERLYDLERSGQLYDKAPVMPANPSALLIDLVGWADEQITLAQQADTLIDDDDDVIAEWIDERNINKRAGAAGAVLLFLLRELNDDRATGLIALINTVEQAPAEQRDRMVDALLATVPAVATHTAPLGS